MTNRTFGQWAGDAMTRLVPEKQRETAVSTDRRTAMESLDEIEAIFIGTRGFPEEVPSEPCTDLCGCSVCDENGCIFQKTALVRTALAALPSPTVETVNGEMLAERLRDVARHAINLSDDARSVCWEAANVLALARASSAPAGAGWQPIEDELRACGPWEYVEPEYLSHDAPGFSQRLSGGGIMATDDEGEPFWIIEGEIEPKFGKLIVSAVNAYLAAPPPIADEGTKS